MAKVDVYTWVGLGDIKQFDERWDDNRKVRFESVTAVTPAMAFTKIATALTARYADKRRQWQVGMSEHELTQICSQGSVYALPLIVHIRVNESDLSKERVGAMLWRGIEEKSKYHYLSEGTTFSPEDIISFRLMSRWEINGETSFKGSSGDDSGYYSMLFPYATDGRVTRPLVTESTGFISSIRASISHLAGLFGFFESQPEAVVTSEPGCSAPVSEERSQMP